MVLYSVMMLLLLLLFLVVPSLLAWESNTCCLLSNEYSALYDFYENLNGSHWVWLEPVSEYGNKWNFTTLNSSLSCPCTDRWQGITCSFNVSTCVVTKIVLTSYNLQGRIPNSIGNFSSMTVLLLNSNNLLVGTIPESIATLSQLTELTLKYNPLTGTLPAGLSQLSSLSSMLIVGSNLVGPIPDSYGDLSNLKYLELYYNFLSQTLPNSLCKLSKLTQLRLYYNMLTGSIPGCIGNLTNLDIIQFNGNLLSHTLPSSLGDLKLLATFNTNDNFLTGWIPDTIGGLVSLTGTDLFSNLLSGPLPPGLFNLTLNTLYINYNLLSGSIPDAIRNMDIVSDLQFYYNCFTGTLPAALGELKMLEILYISNNFLTGNINNVFNITLQRHLSQIELNNNELTGSLPPDIFDGHLLTTFDASVNCLSGSIPDTICNSSLLNVLILDGASSAQGCRASIFPKAFGFGTYSLKSHITGSIPQCLYAMDALSILHLSGNNINSKLDDSIILGDNLKILDLSHNAITGTIPLSFQEFDQWEQLDLSYNKIGGALSQSISMNTNVTLGLNNNRLSGTIPSLLVNMPKVTILDGNIFECGYMGQGLPSSDSDHDKYDCGSNAFNVMIFLWIALSILCAVLIYGIRSLRSYVSDVLAPFANEDHQQCNTFFDNARFQACILTSLIFVVLLPLYGALRHYFSTYAHLYAWTLSSAYLSGVIPGIVLCVAWFCFFCILLIRNEKYNPESTKMITQQTKEDTGGHSRKIPYPQRIALLLFNVGVVTTVNAVFVYITITFTTSVVTVASIALAFFKLVWTRLVLRYFSKKQTQPSLTFYGRRVLLLIVNNVAIPVFATAIIDTSCFYNAFVTASNIVVSFVVNDCVSSTTCTNDECTCTDIQDTTMTVEFTPPFIYSYQCVSSLISTYVPVFAIVLVVETFVIPLRTYIVYQLTCRYPIQSSRFWLIRLIINSLVYDDITKPLDEEREGLATVLNVDAIMMVIINHFTIILTWGVVFPPLTVMVCLAVIVRTYHIQVGIGTKLLQAKKASTIAIIRQEYAVFQVYGHQAGFSILAAGCILCSLVVFDTIGDVTGYKPALGALFALALGPITMVAVWNFRLLWKNGRMSWSSNSRKKEVELRNSSITGNVLHKDTDEEHR